MQKSLVGAFVMAVFSTSVMSYIAMATPIGPWIGPTLVLLATLLYRKHASEHVLVYTTVAGSIGGILATAFGFTFPTLYFLDPDSFSEWMGHPIYFILMVGLLASAAGWYGMWIANLLEPLIEDPSLSFPVGQMIHKMIIAKRQTKKARELAIGCIGTAIFCALQDGFLYLRSYIPKAVTLCKSFSYACFVLPTIHFDLWPMLWAIGFVTGHIIIIPLLVGLLSKLFIVSPIHILFFQTSSSMEFVLAFCSGMVVAGAVMGVLSKVSSFTQEPKKPRRFIRPTLRLSTVVEGIVLLAFVCGVLFLFGFHIVPQVYLIVFTFVCTYQIIFIAGKIGLAQLGRFATFVLVPALFIFQLNAVHITVISTFVEATAGVAVDVLFGKKVIQLSDVSYKRAKRYQYFGLLVSCLTIGVVFWLLINYFTLGSPELFAQRSQARRLLVEVGNFNYMAVLIGVCYGFVLKWLRVHPMLVLGGLLMPFNISIGLIFGGFISMLVRDKQEWYPFWSGVFAANSMWMLIRALL